ncbi:hypothetical protein GCM10009768_14670 [Leucobacter iarius]|uniref:Amino acid permease/ SLC12A domain-containing protein n=1 Tax=Leucobacter iarius TaxID=333963 RepID=A0ABP4XP98_9MICO
MPILLLGDSVIEAFTFVTSVASTFILFIWSMIAISFIQYLRKHPERHASSKFKTPLPRVVPWVVLAFFAFILVTLALADDTRLPLMYTPIWFVVLAGMWQLTKRRLTREGRPLTAAVEIPGTGEDA